MPAKFTRPDPSPGQIFHSSWDAPDAKLPGLTSAQALADLRELNLRGIGGQQTPLRLDLMRLGREGNYYRTHKDYGPTSIEYLTVISKIDKLTKTLFTLGYVLDPKTEREIFTGKGKIWTRDKI